jgi:hypothetical protein
MATANSTVFDQEHPLHSLALEATYQIENLSFLACKVLDESIDMEIQAVRTLVDRIHSLNSVLMTALDEPDMDIEYFAARIGKSPSVFSEKQERATNE